MKRVHPRHVMVVVSIVSLLLAWMLSTQPGGYPDDTFHFANIWCDEGLAGYECSDVEGTPYRLVPNVFTDGSPWWITTDYGTNLRQPTDVYPSLYYGVMRLFAGESVVKSVVMMRLFNVALTVGLALLAYTVIAPARRFGLMVSWLFASASLGFFYLASNHPIGWLVLGVSTGWVFVNALIESNTRRRRIMAAGGFVVALTIMLGSRPEGQLAVLLVVLVGLGTVDREALLRIGRHLVPRQRSRRVLAAGGVLGVLLLLMATLVATTINRVAIDSLRSAVSSGFLARAVDIPYAFMLGLGSNTTAFAKGSFGAQSALLLAAIAGAAALGLRGLRGTRAVTLAAVTTAAFLAPLFLANAEVPVISTAPRYMLVFLALFLATALTPASPESTSDDRIAWWIMGSIATVGHSLALHSTIRLYEVDSSLEWRLGLNSGLKWWWQWGPSPQSTWLVGTVAYGLLIVSMMRHYRDERARVHP